MNTHLRHACFATLVAGIILAPVFGLKLERAGAISIIQPEWGTLFSGMAIVFISQLLRPVFKRFFAKRRRQFKLPVISNTGRRNIIGILILFALVWPFFTSRGQVDIATLVLIY